MQIEVNESFSYDLVYSRIPFDWKNPIGYVLIIFLQTLALICHAEVGTCILILYAGICKFLTEFTIEIKNNLQYKSSDVKDDYEEYTDLTDKLNETIQFHADAKELSLMMLFFFLLVCPFFLYNFETIIFVFLRLANEFSNLYNNHILAYLLFSFCRLTACLLEIHMVIITLIRLNIMKNNYIINTHFIGFKI